VTEAFSGSSSRSNADLLVCILLARVTFERRFFFMANSNWYANALLAATASASAESPSFFSHISWVNAAGGTLFPSVSINGERKPARLGSRERWVTVEQAQAIQDS
jgi:hypothetical protein